MHSYLRLYLTRDDYFDKFSTQIKQKQRQWMERGYSAKQALKLVKRQAWQILKTI